MEFHALAVKVHGWTDNMKKDYYCSGLNADLVANILNQDDSPTLVGWIQLACQVDNWD